MTRHDFIAYALNGELDLNRLAAKLGIARKYRWEEPMVITAENRQLFAGDGPAVPRVYLYYFGGLVFLNCSNLDVQGFFRELTKVSELFRDYPELKYTDRYSLAVNDGDKQEITNDFAVMPKYSVAFVDIISFVIAKSVALERIEEQVDTVLDEMEGLIGLLDRGKLGIPDKKLSKLASTILNFKYKSIASVMVLDKPDITWDNPEADRLYLTMANLFELDQRYQEIKHKSETLMDITGVFTSLSHARRATRLEWIIIVLIFIEIIIYIFEILRKAH
jgi:uncharacterized Rmd1/YagE family protein